MGMFTELRYQLDKLRLNLLRWWFRRHLQKELENYHQSLEAVEKDLSKEAYIIFAYLTGLPLALMLWMYTLMMISEPQRKERRVG